MADTKTKLLDAAENLTQTRGFNGFSYLDLADEIGIKTSSIHYHFKTKADLASAMVERIHEVHGESFGAIDRDVKTPEKRLLVVIENFQDYVRNDKFCLCGMLSVELEAVSPGVRVQLRRYFDAFRAWLAKQFKEMGRRDAKQRALEFLSALEGSLVIARVEGDPKIIRQAMKGFL